MKLALVFLMALVVISQQFYLRQPYSRTFWLSPYPPQDFLSHYQPLVMPMTGNYDTASKDIPNETNGFPDTQSRIKSFGNKQSSSLNNEPAQRFLLGGSFGNNGYTGNGNVRYPFLNTYTTTTTSTSIVVTLSTSTAISTSISSTTSTSTATITSTATLSLTSVVRCIPRFQVSVGAGTCNRKKRTTDDIEDEPQFSINPSETLKVTPTALPYDTTLLREIKELGIPDDVNYGNLRSSKKEVYLDEAPEVEQKTLREKRFFLLNRNYFFTSTATTTSTSTLIVPATSVVQSVTTMSAFATTTITSFLFSNSTITQTVNLITPIPAAQCNALNAVAADENCLSCLPTGFVVCAATG